MPYSGQKDFYLLSHVPLSPTASSPSSFFVLPIKVISSTSNNGTLLQLCTHSHQYRPTGTKQPPLRLLTPPFKRLTMSFFRVSGDRTPVTRTKVAPTRPVRLDSVVATHPEAAISRHATALPLPMPANNSRPKTRRTTRATRLPISQEAWAADFVCQTVACVRH